MSRTYRSMRAQERLTPIHPLYLEIASQLAQVRRIEDRRNCVTCPYCGLEGTLVATISVGSKDTVHNVPLAPEGFRHNIEDLRDRTTEVKLAHCTECERAVDPMAYFTPEVFLRERRVAEYVLAGDFHMLYEDHG